MTNRRNPPAPDRIAGIVLAGGQARRMGGADKPLMSLKGQPLIAHVIARLGNARAISANGDPARFAAFGLPVLPDDIAGFAGPLAGIVTGMDWAAAQGFTHIATAAADTPFFPPDLVAQLARHCAPVVLARANTPDGPRRHPTFGLWDVALRHVLRPWLATGQRKLGQFAAEQGATLAEIPGDDPFFNINTPEDLARAETIAR